MLAVLFTSVISTTPTPSPHGENFKISCGVCHSATSWKLDPKVYSFDHDKTILPLTGQHKQLGCRACHPSLVFSDAGNTCIDCHTDIHEQTTGADCGRCHTTNSWIVENTTKLHQQSRFPLVGAHYTADCGSCHKSANKLRFEPLGIECYDCHQQNYLSAIKPNHVLGKYSKNCIECHYFSSFSWIGAGFNHSFFPLTGGHDLPDCSRCHTNGTFQGLSPECVSCHLNNYNSTTNPNHVTSGFPTNCSLCHTLAPGWKPASYTSHDAQYFPIYSGKHQGTWSSCSVCHTNPANFAQFTCIDCHEHNKSSMDGKHGDVGGYVYSSQACYQCHPTGQGGGKMFKNIRSGYR